MKPMKPMPGSKGQQVTVDLSQAENIVCKSCGNYSFIQSFFLKRISALMSPSGQEAIVPVQVYSCGNCGEVYRDGENSEG
jgi:uncharacterized Zn finger protein|tara:strand:+ start:485 stop:724 length:240 start_codon:yes stop_codon:yes gene_type:complete